MMVSIASTLRRVLTLIFAILLVGCTPRKERSKSETASSELRAPVKTSSPLPPLAGSGGGVIAFVSSRDGGFNLFLMNADGSDQRQLTSGSANNGFPSWSPDGSMIAYQKMGPARSDIMILDVASGTAKVLPFSAGAMKWEPAWSHDGSWIALSVKVGKNPSDIWIVHPDGSEPRKLTESAGADGAPCWSPDDSRIAFFSDRDGNIELYVMNADGSDQRRLTDNAGEDVVSGWFPDGKRILFFSDRDGRYQVYSILADGSGLRRIFDAPTDDSGASFSPDGKKLVVARGSGEETDIWTIGTDGSEARRLTDSPGTDSSPAWRPSGK